MVSMRKMTIVIPRERYFNKLILYLGNTQEFHLMDVDKSNYNFDLFNQKQKTDVENIISRVKRLLEKFQFRELNLKKIEKDKKKISFETNEFNDLIKSTEKKISNIEKNVTNFELNEGEIERDFDQFASEEKDQETLQIIKIKRKSFLNELEKTFETYYSEIHEIYGDFIFISQYMNAFEKSGGNDLISIIKGWVPKRSVEKLKTKLIELTDNKCHVEIENPEKGDLPPTILEKNKYLKPFESLTTQYGIPNYYELDPSLLVAIMFPLLFGLMFGDVGQGIVLMIISGYFIKKTDRTIPKVIFWCGFAATLCGFLYGEFFGFSFEELFTVNGILLFPPLLGYIPNFLTFLPRYQAGHSLIESNFFLLIKFALLVGTIQLLLGYFLQAINKYRTKKYSDLIGFSIPNILFISFFMYCFFVFGLSLFDYFIPSIYTFGLMPIIFILIPIFMMIFGKLIISAISRNKESSKAIIGESLLHTWESGLGFISNISSYLRIFALIISHWALMTVFRTITGPIPVGLPISHIGITIAFYGIMVAGNAIVILIETVLTLTQSIRLTYYEWFGKFYQGDGIAFSPFVIKSNLIKLD